METIFALSTAPGKSGIAVIRLSGPEVASAARAVCGGLPAPRQASLRVLRDQDGARLDEAVVLYFPEGASFTGESVLEFQTHGSAAVISALLRHLGALPGLRAADPGEFTRRALSNGRLDLTQVEALADLLDSETEAQRRQAMRVFSGSLGKKCAEWRAALVRALALLEVTIDFADEEVPVDVFPEVRTLLASVKSGLDAEISGFAVAERIRSGFEVAILGAPNAGKSTLLNTLAGREAAITSEHVGTTRDVIEVRMDLGGLPVTLLDTAGLRETADAVESIGIARARDRAAAADLRVFLDDGTQDFDELRQADDITLRAKADLAPEEGEGVSGLTGLGVDRLVARIAETLGARAQGGGMAIRARHESAMRSGSSSLDAALLALDGGEAATDIAAEEVHAAVRALDSLVGRIGVETVLGEIFASFCLGK
ncbi:tRNA uridine-5-carboxymethylaminomethyl(34) synthesis GTPase MnmE [Roseovarius sp. A46]|uniref:tRNA uridine-5-carboxymethylaminomethyl(34) synthesis GTPase MnmE n=1 Tax=Roseovarius sp. A46 TaxID=2109331 RepID=UPI001010C2DC|nr:tRNA uridine-5-carboxymethylaminomethyl(34) synthesis GTPase MnmE [Roseovarius sp. A46]RXV70097.1 tRNA uridine-5-carboxymethylaminomethyl(34) synthesis GTPase MnmE [Roseovarius sp. A46]